MDKLNLDLLGLSEVRWQGNGYFKTDTKLVIYSGQDDTRKNGVALVLSKKWSNSVSEYKTISDRVICVRVMAVPMNLTVIQVYAPKSELSDDELEVFYAPVQLAVDKAPKSDIVYIMGDWNAKVGNQEVKGIAGKFGLGRRNGRGGRLIEFCVENDLCIANTIFSKLENYLYTWTSPNGRYRNQNAFLLGKCRWRTSVQDITTEPDEDCGSDHELLVAPV